MNTIEKNIVEETLSGQDVHLRWSSKYYTDESEKFYKNAFSFILNKLNAPPNSLFLDAGCGNGVHAIRLAISNYSVVAADLSEEVLKMARSNIEQFNLGDKINLKQENILSLTFEDETFDFVICWGVLMHIPDLEKALSELSRVLRKGGQIVISEANMYGLQAIFQRFINAVLKKQKKDLKKTPAGIEFWWDTPSGLLLQRETNMRWFKKSLQKHQLKLLSQVAGQFTEAYTKVSSKRIRKFIHDFNNLWFRYVKIPHFAYGNILILRKE